MRLCQDCERSIICDSLAKKKKKLYVLPVYGIIFHALLTRVCGNLSDALWCLIHDQFGDTVSTCENVSALSLF